MDIQLLAQKFYDHSVYIRGYSPSTIKRYKQVPDFYCRQTGVTKIEEVSGDNLCSFFIYGRTERNWRPNTFICFHKSLMDVEIIDTLKWRDRQKIAIVFRAGTKDFSVRDWRKGDK